MDILFLLYLLPFCKQCELCKFWFHFSFLFSLSASVSLLFCFQFQPSTCRMMHAYILTLSLVVIVRVLLKSEILKFKHSLGPITVLT